MPEDDEYLPSPSPAVRQQVADYEASAGQRGAVAPESSLPVVILTTRGARSGKLRKTPLMRVERDGRYVLVAYNDGKPVDPAWYHNLTAQPVAIIQDGPVAGRRLLVIKKALCSLSERNTLLITDSLQVSRTEPAGPDELGEQGGVARLDVDLVGDHVGGRRRRTSRA